jgi:hypothetical protein
MFNLIYINCSSPCHGNSITGTAQTSYSESVILSSVLVRTLLPHLVQKCCPSRKLPDLLVWVQRAELPREEPKLRLHARVASDKVSSNCSGNPVTYKQNGLIRCPNMGPQSTIFLQHRVFMNIERHFHVFKL